uniref:Uncharacterized protein n=1 Tax=Arundo donax TaxID=35708 RepID=A0A0A8ZXK6_ARUDO
MRCLRPSELWHRPDLMAIYCTVSLFNLSSYHYQCSTSTSNSESMLSLKQ